MEHATKIQLEIENIDRLKDAELIRHFSCSCMHLPYCYMAFELLCRHYEEEDNFALSLNVDFLPKCIEAIHMHRSELAVVSMPETVAAVECRNIEEQGLKIELLSTQNLNVNLRKDHPVLEHYTPGEPFDQSLLYDYPYVSYRYFSDSVIYPLDFSHPSYCPPGAFNAKKHITVNSADWKARLIGNTNAYGIGTTGPESFIEQYNWFCIPIEGAVSYLYCVHSDRHELSDIAKLFIKYLKEILRVNPK